MGVGGFPGGMSQWTMNAMNMNPMSYWMYMMNIFQRMNQQYILNHQNNINNFGVQGGNRFKTPQSKLPQNYQASFCPFNINNKNQTYNIIFDSSGNFRMNLLVPSDTKMKDLFKAFIQKAGLHESVLGKFINFLFKGMLVDYKDEKTIYEFGIRTYYSTIIVLDTSNLLGGKN